MSEQDDLWRKRFHLFAALRLSGLLIFFLGLGVAFADWLREGGWPLVGVPLAVLGLGEAIIAPKLLKRAWERADR